MEGEMSIMEVKPSATLVNNQVKSRNLKRALLPWILLAPALALLTFVISGPIVGTFILSLTDWNGVRPPSFIGLENYKVLFQDGVFYKSLLNNFKWLVFFLTVPVILGFSVALLVSQ